MEIELRQTEAGTMIVNVKAMCLAEAVECGAWNLRLTSAGAAHSMRITEGILSTPAGPQAIGEVVLTLPIAAIPNQPAQPTTETPKETP